MVAPWNNWFHCIGTTKYSWLRDRRGWRSRHHREHVEGDYKNPPPHGKYDEMLEQSKRLMKGRTPVVLECERRVAAYEKLVEALLFYGAEVVEFAVTAKHYHGLIRFTPLDGRYSTPATGVAGLCGAHHFKDERDPVPRYILGKCHSWCSNELRKMFNSQQSPSTPVDGTKRTLWGAGGLWAPRPKVIPIKDRAHQLVVARYIFDHILEGGAVWSVLQKLRTS